MLAQVCPIKTNPYTSEKQNVKEQKKKNTNWSSAANKQQRPKLVIGGCKYKWRLETNMKLVQFWPVPELGV